MKAIVLSIVTLAFGGCSLLVPKLQAPSLSIADVQLQDSTMWQQHIKVRMHVQNPNDRALPIKGLSYELEVAGEPFAQGVSAASFTVPALGETEFDMNITANMAGTLLKLLGRGSGSLEDEVPYRIKGKVSLSEGLLRSIPFEERGSFKLK